MIEGARFENTRVPEISEKGVTLEMARETPGYKRLSWRQKHIFEKSFSLRKGEEVRYQGNERILTVWGGNAMRFLESEGGTIQYEGDAAVSYEECQSEDAYFNFLEKQDPPCILAFNLQQRTLLSDRERSLSPFFQGLYLGSSEGDAESGIIWGRQNRREDFALEYAGDFYRQCEALLLPCDIPFSGGAEKVREDFARLLSRDRAEAMREPRERMMLLFAARPFRMAV